MKIVNYVEVDGQTLRMEDLSDEKRREIEQKLADRMMEAAGFERPNREKSESEVSASDRPW